MRLEPGFILRAGLALIAVAFLWTATAFLAFAAYTLLIPTAGVAGAAALTGGAIILILALGVIINHYATRQPVTQAQPLPVAGASFTNASAAALAALAKDHPLVAVTCATLLGVADAMRPAERVHRD
jgi:hypothetical protein